MLPVSRRRWAGRIARLVVALVMAGGTAGLAGAGTAQATACAPWNGQPASPAHGTQSNVLNGVAVLSACNVWAVGQYTQPDGPSQTLIEQWTGGTNWTVVPSPNPGNGGNSLSAVSADSPADIWAVGGFGGDSSGGALVVHWNGSSWNQVPVPAGLATGLTGVKAFSASNVWVSGRNGPGVSPAILHWDGTNWTQLQVPSLTPAPLGQTFLMGGLSGSSASDIWTVGFYLTTTPGGSVAAQPLILHWDGSQVSQSPDPTDGSGHGALLFGVSASSPTDAWAVGDTEDHLHSITLHWDGSRWSPVPSPNPGGSAPDSEGVNELDSVVAVSPTNAYAAGVYSSPSVDNGALKSFLVHWNGTAWTQVPSLNPALSVNDLSRVDAGPGGIVWTVGRRGDQRENPILTAGAEYGVVPNVVGSTQAAAVDAVNNAGLNTTVSQVTTPGPNCSFAANGTVSSTTPAAGAFTFAPVTVSVCSVPGVAVPNVFGVTDSLARAKIIAAGLTLGSVTREANCAFPNATVWFESPSGGTQVAPGSSVDLKEATGRQDNGRLCPPTGGS